MHQQVMICWYLIVMWEYLKLIDDETKKKKEEEDYFEYNDACRPLVVEGKVVDQNVWKIHDEMYDEDNHLVDSNNDENTC